MKGSAVPIVHFGKLVEFLLGQSEFSYYQRFRDVEGSDFMQLTPDTYRFLEENSTLLVASCITKEDIGHHIYLGLDSLLLKESILEKDRQLLGEYCARLGNEAAPLYFESRALEELRLSIHETLGCHYDSLEMVPFGRLLHLQWIYSNLAFYNSGIVIDPESSLRDLFG